jgi:hypothetical protein
MRLKKDPNSISRNITTTKLPDRRAASLNGM